ncbi:MAG: hypothetical protein ACR2J8_14760, partial [Thermomicrobiales bacterium]
ISDTCADRRILLQTHQLSGFEACAALPLAADPGATDAAPDTALATPVAANHGVGAQAGLAKGESIDDAIDSLMRQATGCWASGDPARFLALNSESVLSDIAAVAPLADFARELRLFMATPISFKRIGDVTEIDANHAWAYVEISLGGDPVPQRLDFVRQDGVWLFDQFFMFAGDPLVADPAASDPAATEP